MQEGVEAVGSWVQWIEFETGGDLFDEFFIDLTNIGAGSKQEHDKTQLIEYFENLLGSEHGDEHIYAVKQLSELVTLSTNAQYSQGL